MVRFSFLQSAAPGTSSGRRFGSRRAFTLIELAIVLGVASLLFAGLWRLMASGNAQLRDQAAADQQKQLISSVQGYLASSEGSTILRQLGSPASNVTSLALPSSCATGTTTGLCPFLPSGFTSSTKNSYGQAYSIQVRKDSAEAQGTDPKAYSFMILTTNGSTIPDTSGGRISSMIGNDGGFVYKVQACGSTATNMACGSYGAWNSAVTDYGFGSASAGHIASRTYMGLSASQVSIWLARVTATSAPALTNGLPDYNTMQTNLFLYTSTPISSLPTTGHDLYLGGNTIYGGAEPSVRDGHIVNLLDASLGYSNTPPGDSSFSLAKTYVKIFSPCTVAANGDLDGLKPTYSASCNYKALRVYGDVAVNGQLLADYLVAGYFIYNSDSRLKHDIQEIPHALADLAKIKGVSFVFNNDPKNKKRLGVIAQDVEKVYPELVVETGSGFKGVDYMGLIGPIVNAVNELSAENKALKEQIRTQGEEIKALSEKISGAKKE